MELCDQTPQQLLPLHAEVADELRKRGITRSSNNPTGDLAEYLFCKAFQWSRADNSHANIDAVGPDNLRYQIKGRRITRFNNRGSSPRFATWREAISIIWPAYFFAKTTPSSARLFSRMQ